MANTMDVNVAGCTLAQNLFPPISATYYAGSATALDAETTYPYEENGIISVRAVQHASPPMIGHLVKWKDVDYGELPMVERVAAGDTGAVMAGVIVHVQADFDLTDTYINVAVYVFHPGDRLKLYSSDHASATIPVINQGISYYTGERAWEVDNTTGFGKVIKAPPAKGDDFLLMVTTCSGGI